MKICYLANASSVHTRRWVRYFAASGHQVHLISYSPLQDDIPDVIVHLLALPRPYVKILSASVSFIPHIVQVKKLVKKLKPDILHAHYALGYGFFGAASGFHPFLLSAWGSDIMVEPGQNAIFSYMVKIALAKADIVLTTSQYLKGYLSSRFSLADSKIIALPWGVELNTFVRDYRAEGQKLKKDLEIDSGHFIVLSPRNLRGHYRIEQILQAVAYTTAKYPKLTLILLKGAANKTRYESKIDKVVERLGISPNVRTINRYLDAEEMAALYNISNAFISIPRSDQFGSSVQEGMACGAIPIVGNLEVYRQYLVDGHNALFVNPDNPRDIAQKIIYCIEHPELKKKFYSINRKIIEEKEDWSKNAAKLAELYLSFAKERSLTK